MFILNPVKINTFIKKQSYKQDLVKADSLSNIKMIFILLIKKIVICIKLFKIKL